MISFLADSILELSHCTHCKENKPKDRFGKDNRFRSGVNSWCRDCHNAEKVERRKPFLKRRRVIDGLVECFECKQWKLVDDFPVAAKKCETSTGTKPYCWPCQRTLDRKWNALSPGKHDPVRARKRLLHRYGITGDQFDSLFESQGKVCAICKIDKNPCQKNWVVDHCHKTGKVRGVLCGRCNSALGMMRDDIQVVSTALDYLKKHEGSLT